MVKIWRVENIDGIGCYSFGYIPYIKRMIKKHNKTTKKTPFTSKDIGIERDMENGVEICGFIDKKQALNWFSQKELLELMIYGFYLKEVEVTKITAIGQKQVLAIR